MSKVTSWPVPSPSHMAKGGVVCIFSLPEP